MSNTLHVSKLRSGVTGWNSWRRDNPTVRPDLRGEDLRGIRLCGGDRDAEHYISLASDANSLRDVYRDGADLREVDFRGANLVDANLILCDLSGADLSETIMSRALLGSCVLTNTKLYWACMDKVDANNSVFQSCNLDRANLGAASVEGARFIDCSLLDTSLFTCDLSGAQFANCYLSGCDLTYARMIQTSFKDGHLVNCSIYGVSVWDVQADGLQSSDLRITPDGEPTVTVDDLDMAQFLYLILENRRLRGAIDAMMGKMVLILGRFTPERKRVLDALRVQLRSLGLVSVLFDFDKPAGRDLTETVSLLAHMSRFVLADITDPRSIPQELQRIAPSLPSVPIQPLIKKGADVYGMFPDFGGYATVLPPLFYSDDDELVVRLQSHVIPAVQARLAQIQEHRAQFEAALRQIATKGLNASGEA